jgi:mono/diheme cytochrome c family protein
MIALKRNSTTILEGLRRYGLVAGMICVAGFLMMVSLEGTWASERSHSKQDMTVTGDAQVGKLLFEKYCVTCHGPRGRGDGLEIAGANVADLSSARTQRKLNADLLTTIHEGRPGKVMPSWKWQLSEQESKDVLAYIRTLRKK